jgi:plastocyanin
MKVSTARIASLIACLAAATASTAGTVAGRVELIEKGGKKADDVSEAVVWIEGVKVKPQPLTAEIRMKGKAFIPHVLAIPVGGTVKFPNDDAIFHNVFSVSGDNRFDLDLYKKPKAGLWTAQHPGVVRVYCNIHPQMSAIIVVHDNPFFTMAGRDGRFALEGVPAGSYRITAWHERADPVSVDVVVPAEGQATTNLTLDASKFRRARHKNKHGQDYPAREKY